jgi:hypothetical protein
MGAKVLVSVQATNPKFRGCVAAGRWTLCLGAGISRGITPTWFDLTRTIVNETFGSNYDHLAFEQAVGKSGWSLDAWIQAAANEFVASGKKLDEFHELIESNLYGELRKKAAGLPIEKHLLQVLNNPIREQRNRVLAVAEFFENTFGQTSLLGIVRFLIAAAESNKKPYAVITFNADTLLETLVYIFLRRNHYRGPGPHGHPLYHYKSVNRPTTMPYHQYIEKTPIFHCHGTIMPKRTNTAKPNDSRDRLIFLEQEYLRVASTTAAWPETLFLFHAQTTRMLFAGLSMSDANIRRWMRSSELELALDHERIFSGTRINPEHLWITREPSETHAKRLELVSMLHLGIRPAWIDDWSELEPALRNMLAL